MNERKKISIQILKNTLSNFILYAVIFTLFAGLLYLQVNLYLYASCDKDLRFAAKEWVEQKEKHDNTDSNANYLYRISNFNVIAIERGEDGKINTNSYINPSYLEYFSDINFDDQAINKIYEMNINNNYHYRAINVKYISKVTGETSYVQLLVNIDSEKAMISIFSKTLIVGCIIIILLILVLTYLLCKKSLDPIVKNYEKQTEFVQNASHELRTPLTIIQAKQEMLLKYPDSKIIDKSEDIALTLNETRRLTKLVKELMDLARADASSEKLNKEQIDINKFIEDVSTPYRELSNIDNKSFSLDLNATKKCLADRNKLKQLMIILMDNALKYTEENDSIEINTSTSKDECVIEIKDTGIGISDEALKHVFERFYREDKARSREKGGSGLGLSIAQTIVKLHGGSIKITHNKPKGTIVTIKL